MTTNIRAKGAIGSAPVTGAAAPQPQASAATSTAFGDVAMSGLTAGGWGYDTQSNVLTPLQSFAEIPMPNLANLGSADAVPGSSPGSTTAAPSGTQLGQGVAMQAAAAQAASAQSAAAVNQPASASTTADPPAATPAGPTLRNTSFGSTGDPHEVTADGTHFDNELTGDFVALTTASGDLTVEKHQDHVAGFGSNVTLNTKVAVDYLGDKVVFDVGAQSLTVNGQSLALAAGASTTTPGGVTVSYDGKTVHITTPKGDAINLINQGKWIDMSGNVSSQRTEGSVFGELGTFSDDKATDLSLRDGFVTSDVSWFLNDWRVQSSDPQLL